MIEEKKEIKYEFQYYQSEEKLGQWEEYFYSLLVKYEHL
jgi:hypothetical protein